MFDTNATAYFSRSTGIKSASVSDRSSELAPPPPVKRECVPPQHPRGGHTLAYREGGAGSLFKRRDRPSGTLLTGLILFLPDSANI
jgi:hypothetical protein